MHTRDPGAPGWTLVVPVKPVAVGKSRLGGAPALARAIALDTIEAVARSASVDAVVVVTADTGFVDALAGMPSVRVVPEQRAAGIAAAIRAGLADAPLGAPRAALLGDVPGLLPAELDEVLARAVAVPRAFVPDADGTGTVLVTASGGAEFVEAFGPGSAAAHRALGLAELAVDASSGLRRDVDTLAQLAEVIRRAPDGRTARAAQA